MVELGVAMSLCVRSTIGITIYLRYTVEKIDTDKPDSVKVQSVQLQEVLPLYFCLLVVSSLYSCIQTIGIVYAVAG